MSLIYLHIEDIWKYKEYYIIIFMTQYTFNFWEGNGTPLQYSCLENPMDGGAW